MKKAIRSLLVGVFFILLVFGWPRTKGFRGINELINYFSSAPYQLLSVAVVALGGGVLVVICDRWSAGAKRRARLWFLAGAAGLLALIFGCFACQTLASKAEDMSALLLFGLFFAAISGFIGFEFFRTMKKGPTE